MSLRKKWFSSRVVSTEGFSVDIRGRNDVLYVEGDLRVYVYAEMSIATSTWALYPNDMRIGSRYGPLLNDEKLRSLILERVQSVFDFHGVKTTTS
jgi:hypothetical protein